jgi:hypothetical protein
MQVQVGDICAFQDTVPGRLRLDKMPLVTATWENKIEIYLILSVVVSALQIPR